MAMSVHRLSVRPSSELSVRPLCSRFPSSSTLSLSFHRLSMYASTAPFLGAKQV